MGMFDSVNVPCPKCGTKAEFQSKSGSCVMRVYELDEAPLDVLMDINRHSPYTCRECGCSYAVKVSHSASAVLSAD